jgi:hypothetical protein
VSTQRTTILRTFKGPVTLHSVEVARTNAATADLRTVRLAIITAGGAA